MCSPSPIYYLNLSNLLTKFAQVTRGYMGKCNFDVESDDAD